MLSSVLQVRLKILAKLSDEVKGPLMKLHNSLNGKVHLIIYSIIIIFSHIQIYIESVWSLNLNVFLQISAQLKCHFLFKLSVQFVNSF